MMRCFAVFVAVVLAGVSAWSRPTTAGEIGFLEDFALATDRAGALKQLIPGTDDFYYFHALHYLNTEQFDKAEQLLEPWRQRHNGSPRYLEIETRLMLLTYPTNPQRTLGYLRNRLGVSFNHQREQLGQAPDLPSALNPELIARATLLRNGLAQNASLNPLEPSAWDWLNTVDLSPDHRRHYLRQLARPDYAKLAELIVADLNHEPHPNFGDYAIHRQLLRSQLDELLKLKAELRNQGAFVETYTTRLQPGPDDDWRHDAAILVAYLERLQAFVDTLEPVHNSLKAHVLHHRLVLDRSLGKLDKARFLKYLALPRPMPYVAPKLIESVPEGRFHANLNTDFRGTTLLPIVGNDEPLVRAYLANFLVDAANYAEFEPYVHDVYLRHLFAETKIVNGLGDAEQWASQLPPELFQQLKQRVDIDFAPTNPTSFTADQPVRLDAHVKNVSTLIVKVFEINAPTYYRQNRREIDTDVNLDGLVANEEFTFNYDEPALRRVARRFEFPKLSKPGIYVIDFIGNGRSSRALIRKGRLRQVVKTTPAGQRFTVFDEANEKVADATLWLSGHEYKADKDGRITVPFSTAPGPQPIVIARGELASLDTFQHEGESYELRVGFHVDREALLSRQQADLLIRPGLYLNGTPIAPGLLEDVRLQVISTNHDGVASSQLVPNVKLFEDRETVHPFQVPARLASLQFSLRARIKTLTTGQPVELVAGETVALNEIDRTEKLEDLHLVRLGPDWAVELRGKTGEPRPNRAVQLSLKHQDFKQPVNLALKTDARGRVLLGALPDIDSVTAAGPEGTSHRWPLRKDRHTYVPVLHGRAGATLTIPYLGKAAAASRSELSLLELKGDAYVADHYDRLAVRDGLVELRDLPAGDYDLWLKATGDHVRVRVVPGEVRDGFLLGKLRLLEMSALAPLQVAGVASQDDKLVVTLRNASPVARVHVFATRMEPAYSPFDHLSRVTGGGLYAFYPGSAESVFLTGRNIGDEYRYIIDRRYAKKYPGNSLERPSLLLNPWVVRSTETGTQVAQAGDDFRALEQAKKSDAAREKADSGAAGPGGDFANLDFLADASVVLANLVPDKNGVVSLPKAALGMHQRLYVVAVDPLQTTFRSYALPEDKLALVDLRLAKGLDPKAHFTQQKQITVLSVGQTFVLDDVTSSRIELYDQLSRVYGLYETLTHNPQLAEFRFLLDWPTLKPEEKRAQYSKYACHELNVFLAKKDPEFFRDAIRPYLANKKDKTFIDRWLLGEPLNAYLEPWNHGRLNVAERILLGERIANERPLVARHVRDQLELLPPDIERFLRLFETAVQGSVLETASEAGLRIDLLPAQNGVVNRAFRVEDAVPAPAADSPAPPGAPPMPALAGRPLGAAARQRDRDSAEQALKEVDAKQGRAKADRSGGGGRGGRDESNVEAKLFAERFAMREARQLYRKLDPTKEWAENNYYNLPIGAQVADLVKVNAFWRDYADRDPAQPFQSKNLAESTNGFSEMVFALALLDLPYAAGQHDVKYDGARMTLKAASPMIVFHEEVKPVKAAELSVPILVTQNFFRHGDRHRVENGEQVDKFISEEFLTHVVYGCQVVVTNPTSTRQKLSVLTQIPLGAIPVLNSQATRTVHVDLQPYHTQTLEYHFYFPQAGDYAQFPVHVAKNEQLLAFAAPTTLHVVVEPTKIDTQSWEYVSQNGTNDEVVAFLDKHNLGRLNLEKIAFRLKDAAFFAKVTQLLATRHVYHPTVWSYGLAHNQPAAIREFCAHLDTFVNECGGRLNSPLLTIDPVARHSYEHLEYKPLVNARAHALGQRRQIVNDRFFAQYHALLRQLGYQRQLTDDDWMATTYYLLLQDRVDEAFASFRRVKPENITTRMQYDYLAAYLEFFQDAPAKAREIALRYANHPVDRWRNTFAAILAQLDDIEGKGVKAVDPLDRDQQQTKLAATEPSLEIQMEARQLTIRHQNVATVQVNYYLMDVELLFSRNPFVQQFSGQFSSIRPNHSTTLALAEKATETKVPLPAELHNRNVLIEVTGGGQTRTQAYYAHSLAIQVIENYGQIRVTHATTQKPVSKAYVKVYAQHADGSIRFYKDGYTDLRGRFEYASLSTNDLETAGKFAILVVSDEHGVLVREAAPPKR